MAIEDSQEKLSVLHFASPYVAYMIYTLCNIVQVSGFTKKNYASSLRYVREVDET